MYNLHMDTFFFRYMQFLHFHKITGSLLALMNELRNNYHDNVGLLVSGLAQVI